MMNVYIPIIAGPVIKNITIQYEILPKKKTSTNVVHSIIQFFITHFSEKTSHYINKISHVVSLQKYTRLDKII